MEMKVARKVNTKAMERVKGMSDSDILSYLNDSTMALGVALDMWQHHSAPSSEVTIAVDAIVALWCEAESRSLVTREMVR